MVWTKHLCRICAQIGDACYPIFDTIGGRNIEMKMRKCFSFAVSRDDYKPKEICNCCYMKLNQLYEFVDLCYSSNNKFETMMYSNQGLWLEKQTQNYDDCQLSGVIVNSKTNLEHNLGSSDVIMVVDYENSLHLNQTSNQQVSLNTPYNSSLDIRAVDINKDKTNANFKTYQCCEQTQTVLRHSSDFYKSLETTNVNNFINLGDNVDYNSMDNRYEKEKSLCDIANVKNNDVLQSNDSKINNIKQQPEGCIKLVTKKRPFCCSHCNKKFTQKKNLMVHLSIHTKVKPYICDCCDKSFAIEKHLKYHKRIHSDTYQCEYCAKSFSVLSKLERHVRIHTNTKPFVCPVEQCRKSFSDKCNLELHKVSHSDQKNFRCDICNKSCKTNSQLKDHRKVHDNQTPYKCHLCGKMYKWKNCLTVHMKKHNGYKCIHCNKDCKKLSEYFRHRRLCK